MIQLYLLDDHALFREGLLRLLERDAGMRVVGASGSPEEALRALDQVDVLILDFDLGEQTALDVMRKISGVRVLLVTAGLSDEQALQLIQLGVCGIILKSQPPTVLYQGILDAAQGKTVLDQAYLQRLTTTRATPRLTERDRQVLRLVIEGLSNKEIADRLRASESAIKSSLQQLFSKTNVRTRAQLVRLALEDLRDEL